MIISLAAHFSRRKVLKRSASLPGMLHTLGGQVKLAQEFQRNCSAPVLALCFFLNEVFSHLGIPSQIVRVALKAPSADYLSDSQIRGSRYPGTRYPGTIMIPPLCTKVPCVTTGHRCLFFKVLGYDHHTAHYILKYHRYLA